MNPGLVAALLVMGAYLFGRIEQYFRDEKRGLGPKQERRSK